MSSGLGYFDPQGVWRYGESDAQSLASDLLNLGQASISSQFAADRNRLDNLEGEDALTKAINIVTVAGYTSPGSTSGIYWGSATITFPFPFKTPPAVHVDSIISGTIVVCQIQSISTTQVSFRAIRFGGVVTPGDYLYSTVGVLV